MRQILERCAKSLPLFPGQCAASVLVGARSTMWEIWYRQGGDRPARPEELHRLATVLVKQLEAQGLSVLFEPTLVLGGELLDGQRAERVALVGGAELLFRRRGEEARVDALGAIEAARELAEHSVLKLASGLDEVFQLSQQQCGEMQEMAHRFDESGGLGDTIGALETELSGVNQALRTSLAGHLKDVEGAASCAMDIVKLASAVEQIAQSARLLTFNARLESARLGDAGKGFVVIANAIRELANDVRTSNDLVTNLATNLVSTLPQLQQETMVLASASETQLDGVRARLASLRGAFRSSQEDARADLRKTEAAANAVRDRSHEVMQHLQFQDRSNQLLTHAKSQVQTMEAALGVREERGSLVGEAKATSPGDVTLF